VRACAAQRALRRTADAAPRPPPPRRYNARTDTLRLVSQRYFTREDNRSDCLRIIHGAACCARARCAARQAGGALLTRRLPAARA
jgi:hypothetical protein